MFIVRDETLFPHSTSLLNMPYALHLAFSNFRESTRTLMSSSGSSEQDIAAGDLTVLNYLEMREQCSTSSMVAQQYRAVATAIV